jgi:putative transposase
LEVPTSHITDHAAWLKAGVGDDELPGIRQHLKQEHALGSRRFQAMVEKALGRPVAARPPGRPRREQIGNG